MYHEEGGTRLIGNEEKGDCRAWEIQIAVSCFRANLSKQCSLDSSGQKVSDALLEVRNEAELVLKTMCVSH